MMLLFYYAIQIFKIIFVIRILMSWIKPDPHNQFVKLVYDVTDPVLDPIRKLLPMNTMGIDFSPIVVFLIIGFLEHILMG